MSVIKCPKFCVPIFLLVMFNYSGEELIKRTKHSCWITRESNRSIPRGVIIIVNYSSDDLLLPGTLSDKHFFLLFFIKPNLTTHLQVFEENHINILKRKLILNSGKIYYQHNYTFI